MSTRRFTSNVRPLRAQYGFDTSPAPFDPRPSDQRDTIIMFDPREAAHQCDDPILRADVLAELDDHAPAKPARRLFDLMAPDVANEKPMTAERRAAMHSDRETIKLLLIYTGMVLCAGAFCWSVFQVARNLWLLFGVAGALS